MAPALQHQLIALLLIEIQDEAVIAETFVPGAAIVVKHAPVIGEQETIGTGIADQPVHLAATQAGRIAACGRHTGNLIVAKAALHQIVGGGSPQDQITAHRCRHHIEGHGVGRWIGINAAIGRAAVVLHLEGEGGIAITAGTGSWCETQARQRTGGNRSTGCNGNPIERERASGRCAGDQHSGQGIAISITETEIRGAEVVETVLINGDGGVGSGRSVVGRRLGRFTTAATKECGIHPGKGIGTARHHRRYQIAFQHTAHQQGTGHMRRGHRCAAEIGQTTALVVGEHADARRCHIGVVHIVATRHIPVRPARHRITAVHRRYGVHIEGITGIGR